MTRQKQNRQCMHCERPTNIRRGYGVALLITLLILVGPFALIYYFHCRPQCQACGGTDIQETGPAFRGRDPDDSGGGGTNAPPTGAPV